MKDNKKKIFICATEQSGDNIGANIILELLKSNKQISFSGVGGSKMSVLLSKTLYNLSDFNSMGIIEILFSIKKYIRMLNYLVKHITTNDYDLIITIDSPDFNYPLVKKLRKKLYDKKIIHIVAPSVWAWRPKRAKNFSKVFDELFILFGFESKYFEKYNLKTFFIGHPIYYLNSNQENNNNKSNIAFLPGSRASELKSLYPYFFLAYKQLLKHKINTNIFIPTLPHLKEEIIRLVSNWQINVIVSTDKKIIEENYLKVSKALVCSGTASLEIAKRNIPQLTIYKLNFFTELIASFFIKIKFASIINIIKDEMIIDELTNSSLNKTEFIKYFNKLIFDKDANKIQIEETNIILKSLKSNKAPYILASDRIKRYLI